MADDIRHINKQIQKDQVNAEEARRRAQNERIRAQQLSSADADGRSAFHDAAAIKLEQDADELEDEALKLQQERERLEQQVADLEQERSRLIQEHDQKIGQINKDIARLRGENLM